MPVTSPVDRLTQRLRLLIWVGAAAVLAAPAVAMHFTAEVHWTAFDFLVAALLLAIGGTLADVVLRVGSDWRYRLGGLCAVGGLFLLVWVDLAVGLIGTAADPANRLFALVIATAIGGAAWSRLRANGLAVTLVVMAIEQLAIAALATALRLGTDNPVWPRDVLGTGALFAAIWLTAAALLASARRRPAGAPAKLP